MNPEPVIAVFAGGTSPEREVSLGSGRACALALARSFPTRLFQLDADALPAGLDPARHIVFSTLHGTFGEDGGMQALLDRAGVEYAGCGAASSALTMDKSRTKAAAAARGVGGAAALAFPASARPPADEIIRRLGAEVVLKPNDQGSSVGLTVARSPAELAAALDRAMAGNWLAEAFVRGRELSVGVLAGKAMGIVEIRPRSGVYDFASKYTKGMTEYFAPAPLAEAAGAAVRSAAEAVFAACGCRDYARVDFILTAENTPILLEINTLPGMKETSLLPMSARCVGLDFVALVRELVRPALQRFASARQPVPS
ncbi:MAG TPA: D-alanine--D-alanine ligase [Opitutaceae bacterium]|nr:D-alanine--D-alanine ligase [Opitutaceae bacterium]